MTKREGAKARAMSKRRVLVIAGAVAGASGLLLGALGWWQGWRALQSLGVLGIILGAVWLVCARFTSDEPMRAVHSRYLREFFPAMLAYVVLLFLAVWLMDKVHAGPLRVLVALLPALPVIWVLRAMLHFLMDSDELEQKMQLQAIAMAAGSVAFLSFAAAFLKSAGLLPIENPLMWVLPAMFAAYGVGMWWARRRYRGE